MSDEPLLQVLEDLASPELFAEACKLPTAKGWYFGHSSNTGDAGQFWTMDLTGIKVFDAIWEHARRRCEPLAGGPLRVLRQYANGHTFGLGGQPHTDDARPGTFTLLYYPVAEWPPHWDGETVFYNDQRELERAVTPRPNRAVLFDSRLLHAGRAPSRACPALRVSVAYKLQRIESVVELPAKPEAAKSDSATPGTAKPEPAKPEPAKTEPAKTEPPKTEPAKTEPAKTEPASEPTLRETARAGAERTYTRRVSAERVAELTDQHLAQLGASVRLPGFRPGKIPLSVLAQRYGQDARARVLERLANEAAGDAPPGSLVVGVDVGSAGVAAGSATAVELRVRTVHLPDLAEPDLTGLTLERLTADDAALAAAGLTRSVLEEHLRGQLLDHLDRSYRFGLPSAAVEREFAAIWRSATADSATDSATDTARAELRQLAERRVRLAIVVAELARRAGITGADAESAVVGRLLAKATVRARPATPEELRDLA